MNILVGLVYHLSVSKHVTYFSYVYKYEHFDALTPINRGYIKVKLYLIIYFLTVSGVSGMFVPQGETDDY